MLTKDEINELIELLRQVNEGKVLQVYTGDPVWSNCEYGVLAIADRLKAGHSVNSNLRIAPEPVRMYGCEVGSRIEFSIDTKDYGDTHYIDIHEDGSITGGRLER